MKIVSREVDSSGGGFITIIPEESEDLWHIYNILSVGDIISTSTFRKHHKETNTGMVSTERVKIRISLKVTKIDYEAPLMLRISGQNRSENRFIKKGQFHTFKIFEMKKITIGKVFWDELHLNRLQTSADVSKKAEVGVVVMEEGIAYVCLVTSYMTLTKQKIESSISKKTYQSSHERTVHRFFESILQSILKHIDFSVVKVLIIGSPGFVRDDFMEYVKKQSHRPETKPLLLNMNRLLLVHVNSGQKQSIKEIFSNKSVVQKLENKKMAEEVKVLNLFFKKLNEDDFSVVYGSTLVEKAQEHCAIEALLITDNLFRSLNIKERKKYVKLTEIVKNVGGKVYIFSSMHPSGQQLDRISGIAAILRFPMPNIFQENEEKIAKKKEQKKKEHEKQQEDDGYCSSDHDGETTDEEDDGFQNPFSDEFL